MAVKLKVDTGAMQRLAQTLSSEVTEVLKNFQDIQIVMKGTGNYWHGDAADADRKGFSDMQQQIDELIKSLESQPGKLCEVAEIMQTTEMLNADASAELTTDDFV